MNHFMNFDPYMTGEHNRQRHAEIDSFRARERPRDNCESRYRWSRPASMRSPATR